MEKFCTKCGKPAQTVRPSLFVCDDGHDNWINPPVGAIAFIMQDDKVLYGVRSRDPGIGKLCLPGGILEIGDTGEATAVREAKEEVGLDVEVVTLLKTYATNYTGRPILNLVYIVRMVGGTLTPGDDMSGGEPVWRLVDDLPRPDEVAFEWYAEAQRDLLAWWQQNRG